MAKGKVLRLTDEAHRKIYQLTGQLMQDAEKFVDPSRAVCYLYEMVQTLKKDGNLPNITI